MRCYLTTLPPAPAVRTTASVASGQFGESARVVAVFPRSVRLVMRVACPAGTTLALAFGLPRVATVCTVPLP